MNAISRTILIVLCALALHLPIAAESKKLIRHSDNVPNQYFVGINEHSPAALDHLAHSIAMSYGGSVIETFPAALGGFLVEIPAGNVLRMADDSRVTFVEENARLELEQPQVSASAAAGDSTYLWWLDRIDQQYPDSSGNLDGQYYYCNTGTGVVVYILDEGIDETHPELQGRVVIQHDFYGIRTNVSNPCKTSASGWHGTAVASILAGRYSGVADGVKIVALNTNACPGYSDMRALVGALNWIIAAPAPTQAPSYSTSIWLANPNPYVGQPGVVNVSNYVLPGSTAIDVNPDGTQWNSPTIETVYRSVASAGHTIVTSANNYTWDACRFAPANLAFGQPNGVAGSVITVGGTGFASGVDKRWNDAGASGKDKGSNSGNCISLWAPAQNVYAARHSGYSPTGKQYDTASGTSFSAPIVAGMAARFIQRYRSLNGGISPTPQQVYTFLESTSVKYTVGSTTNRLVKETQTPGWWGTDPTSPTTSVYHPPIDTWRIVGNAFWRESCRVRPVRR